MKQCAYCIVYLCALTLRHCSGLIVHPEGPLNPDKDAMSISEMFRPFQTLLFKIRYVLVFSVRLM